MKLKQRFLHAVSNGDIGSYDDVGVIVTQQDMHRVFPEVSSLELQSFLPSSVIDEGYSKVSENKFLFFLKEGAYRVHPDALELYDFTDLESLHSDTRLQ